MLLRATMALFWKFYKRLSFESERVSYSVVSNSVSLWTVVPQAPLFMGFSRQEYWSGLSCPPPGDLPSSGIEPKSFKSFALADEFFTNSATLLSCYSVNVRI